jgi:hypothetical protein
MTATYAQWLEEYQCFDLSNVPIPCYRCGEGTVASCSLCGVYVCNECSEPDEADDSICLDCVAHGCKQGVHYHTTNWSYADEGAMGGAKEEWFEIRGPVKRRIAISSTTRRRVLEKYDNTCAFCKSTENLQIDHIIAVAAGGTNDENNLRVLCRACNIRRDTELLTRTIEGTYVCYICGREGILHLVKIKEEEVTRDSPLIVYAVRRIQAYSVLVCDNCSYLETAIQEADSDTDVLRYNEQYVLVGQKNIEIATTYINEAQSWRQEANE